MLALSGSTRPSSTSDGALHAVGRILLDRGATITHLTGRDLMVPVYDTESTERHPGVARLLAEVARADAVVLASPGYHGGMSGLLKNALDYLEDTATADRPYLTNRPVGLIATSRGWQAAAATLAGMRSVVHALRGWPTPLGVCINSALTPVSPAGQCADEKVTAQLRVLAEQVLGAAQVIGLPSAHSHPATDA